MATLNEIRSHTINMSGMNAELKELYSGVLCRCDYGWRHQNDIQTDENNGDYLTNPYFLAVSDEYQRASRRIMIIGQETFSWGKELHDGDSSYYPEISVEDRMKFYDYFVNGKQINTWFWRFGRAIEEQCNQTAFIYNNVAKIGWNGKAGFDKTLQPHILADEIKITNPDVLVFAIGRRWEYMVELENNGIVPSNKHPLVTKNGRIYSEKWEGLGRNAFWCYHPRYLNIRKVLKDVAGTIVEAVNK